MSFYENQNVSDQRVKLTMINYLTHFGVAPFFIALAFYSYGEILKKLGIDPSLLNFSIAVVISVAISAAMFPSSKKRIIKQKSRVPLLKKYGKEVTIEVVDIKETLKDLRLNEKKKIFFSTKDNSGFVRNFQIEKTQASVVSEFLNSQKNIFNYDFCLGKKEWLNDDFKKGSKLKIRVNPEDPMDFIFEDLKES